MMEKVWTWSKPLHIQSQSISFFNLTESYTTSAPIIVYQPWGLGCHVFIFPSRLPLFSSHCPICQSAGRFINCQQQLTSWLRWFHYSSIFTKEYKWRIGVWVSKQTCRALFKKNKQCCETASGPRTRARETVQPLKWKYSRWMSCTATWQTAALL